MIDYMGLQVIEDVNMVDNFQNRKHHKKRINKKWIKRYGITVKPKTDVFIFDGKIICHPVTYRKIVDEITEQAAKSWEDIAYPPSTNTQKPVGILGVRDVRA